MQGRIDTDTLKRLVADAEIDTIIAAFPDMYGRLVGKRIVGHFFVDEVIAHGLHAREALGSHGSEHELTSRVIERQDLVARHHQFDRLDPCGRRDRRTLGEAADVAVDPLHVTLRLDASALGHEVVDVGRPVLDRRVRDASARLDHDLDDR